MRSMNLAVYYRSAERYNNSFKRSHLAYWGKMHVRMCNKLDMPSLLLPAGQC
jgi:hypothetical protein